MDYIEIITSIGTLLVTIIGVWIALSQLRSANHDSKVSRMAEMAWQLYQSYTEPRMRDARGAAEKISHTTCLPQSGIEYGQKYADKNDIVPEPNSPSLDTLIRRLLRFYNQAGILLEKQLIDADILFEFIGPGLDSSWKAIEPAINWYQYYYGGPTGFEKSNKRNIYNYVQFLYEKYLEWKIMRNYCAFR